MAPSSPSKNSDAILAAARASLSRQREQRFVEPVLQRSFLERLKLKLLGDSGFLRNVRKNRSAGNTGGSSMELERILAVLRRQIPRAVTGQVDRIIARLHILDKELAHDGSPDEIATARKLVGDDLVAVVEAYLAIPVVLRGEKQADASPDQKLLASLNRIEHEIADMTRRLAAGAIDHLAIQQRYLDLKYGDTMEKGDIGDLGAD